MNKEPMEHGMSFGVSPDPEEGKETWQEEHPLIEEAPVLGEQAPEDQPLAEEPPVASAQPQEEKFVINLPDEAWEEFGDPELDQGTYEEPQPALEPEPKKKRKRPKRKVVKEKISPVRMVIKIVIALIVLGIAVAVATVGVLVIKDVMGFKDGDEVIEISIEPDETVTAVANKMEEAGVIDSAFVFRAYVRYATDGIQVNFGKYALKPSMSYSDIINTLQEYSDQSSVTKRITIKEGATVEEIAQIMQDNAICTKEAFIDEVNNGEFKASFVQALDETKDMRPYRLEGYLFPDTNDYYIGSDAHDVVSKMLVNFDKRFTSDMRQLAKQKGYTIDEIMTMASIVQAEATPEEMANVAGVYWNRLNSPSKFPKMQSDPTTLYAEHVLKPLKVSQEILDGYNTYATEGLPTGPINNPGAEAIEAVLNPSNTDAYFFLSTKDGSEFYYAETYEEHKQNIKKAGLDESLG